MRHHPHPHRWPRAACGALIVTLVALGACSGDDGDRAQAADRTTTTTTVAEDGTTTTSAAAWGGPSGSDTTEAPAPGTAPSDASGPTPSITSFTTPGAINCHDGNAQTFTARWATTDAVKVTISIDGPGVYDEYPSNGEASLPFSCTSSHTFLLTARGAGGLTATRTVTIDPQNVQPPANADQDQ